MTYLERIKINTKKCDACWKCLDVCQENVFGRINIFFINMQTADAQKVPDFTSSQLSPGANTIFNKNARSSIILCLKCIFI